MIRKFENAIKNKIKEVVVPSGFYFRQKGYCPCCDRQVFFEAHDSWLRDHFLCSNCGCIPRERALMLVIEKYHPNWRELSIHESSPCNRGTSLKLKKYCK